MTKSLMFLYLKTGGGHFAPAKAISEVIRESFGDKAKVTLHDGLDGCSRTARFLIEDGYRILQSRARWYYALLYFFNKFLPFAWGNILLVSNIIKPVLSRKIIDARPDVIVLFHFFLTKPTIDILASLKLNIPVVTVVTDPHTAHPIWFLVKTTDYIVFSEDVRRLCIQSGIPERQVSTFAFPVSDPFSHSKSQEENVQVMERLGIPQGKSTVLIFGGADGIPRGERILRVLLRIRGIHILMVCGKDDALLHQAENLVQRGSHRHVKLFGFVDFVHDLISVSDIVVSKCGASTFMEILLLGKIPIVTDYIWEQEKGNVDFLRDHRIGFFEPNLEKMQALVEDLLTREELAGPVRDNIRKMHLRSGTRDIAGWLARYGKSNP